MCIVVFFVGFFCLRGEPAALDILSEFLVDHLAYFPLHVLLHGILHLEQVLQIVDGIVHRCVLCVILGHDDRGFSTAKLRLKASWTVIIS